jgi:hypothetical protein
MNDIKTKIEDSLNQLKDKKSRIYFVAQDTKGNARASIKYIYDVAMALKDSGFNPIILHEKKDYTGVASWLDESYMTNLPHRSIEGENLEISPEDFIVLPEIYGFIMEQIKDLPCGKIVLTQSYSYVLDTLQPGQSWPSLGFLKCITTSEKQKERVESYMKKMSYDVITPYISEIFDKPKLPPMPIVAVHTRDQTDTINIVKEFYLKYPQFRWFTFRDMRGLTQLEFANSLKNCFLSVWIDDISGFGTYPLESMSCGIPVIGKIPDLIPEWMNENNGIWVQDKLKIVDYIAEFIQNWLEDSIVPELYEEVEKTGNQYKDKEKFTTTIINCFTGYFDNRINAFQEQLNKI